MTKNARHSIHVHAHWKGLDQPVLMGELCAIPSRGKEIFSFQYSDSWLKSNYAQAIDPSLQLYSGPQYAPEGQGSFGIFLDSAPDRWGRFLMDRREAINARQDGRKERKLLESDYLLGVYDEHRMGALRFCINPQGPFLDNNKAHASPPFVALRELEHASLELEKADAEHNPRYSKWLEMLVAPGSSLGGARPKASVVDEQKQLWIAKFPSASDENDIGAWEMVAHNLAEQAGITCPKTELRKFNSKHHTFLSKRFDRTAEGERVHFASALTLLQRTDGDDAKSGASYLELAEFISQHGAHPHVDLEQLWRRIVFFMCVSNVDDHLRNHGFILTSHGWQLAPAYDVNPVASGNGLKLNVSESDNSQDLELALEVAPYFRIKPQNALEIIKHIIHVVSGWRSTAGTFGISSKEQERMSRAFRLEKNNKINTIYK